MNVYGAGWRSGVGDANCWVISAVNASLSTRRRLHVYVDAVHRCVSHGVGHPDRRLTGDCAARTVSHVTQVINI